LTFGYLKYIKFQLICKGYFFAGRGMSWLRARACTTQGILATLFAKSMNAETTLFFTSPIQKT